MISTALRHLSIMVLAILTLGVMSEWVYAIDPRFELDPRMLDRSGEPEVRGRKGGDPRKRPRSSGEMSEYTVKPGDHIFRILMREYGLSNAEAEALVPEVRRINGISDIRRLRVGQSIRIPLARREEQPDTSEPKVSEVARGGNVRVERPTGGGESPARVKATETLQKPLQHSMRMMNIALEGESLGMERVRQAWDELVPYRQISSGPVLIEDRNFTLSLDPETFPTFPGADGGRIIVDVDGKIPPLVRSLIEQKDPSIRIVSENPRNRRRFMASLLAGARFYSVEENVSLSFGSDPRLTVNADFKIEKTPESLLNHEVVLMNVADHRGPMPPSLVQFLRNQGFQVMEPFPSRETPPARGLGTLHQITAREVRGVVDGLLKALNLHYENDRGIELYGVGDGGLRLQVKVDRYFERGTDRYVVSYFDGDPVTYTLTRLLETRGYRVIVLDPKDDFRRVSEKLLTRLRLPGVFARHDLISSREVPYDVQISGVRLGGRGVGEEPVFFTDVEIDPLFREILGYNGYRVISY